MSESEEYRAVNTFAVDLLNELFKSEQRNIFFSPLSIFTCMNLALLGARNETESNLFNGLRCRKSFENVDQVRAYLRALIEHYLNQIEKQDQNKDEKLSFLMLANRVLIAVDEDDPVTENYANGVRETFHAQVDEVNFANDEAKITDSINDWVKMNTRNMIERILNPGDIDSSTIAVLLNAIFFHGKWEKSFNAEDTEQIDFHNNGLQCQAKKVAMMFAEKINVHYSELELNGVPVRFVEIPYTGNYSISIILPKALDGVNQITSLTYSDIQECSSSANRTNVKLWLPKFKFETNYTLNEILMKLGITNAFTNAADFTGIKNQPIKISKVIHKAAIEVDEEGTKAAAVTAVIMARCAMPMRREEISVRIDHPFIFFIEDTSKNLILFAGKVLTL